MDQSPPPYWPANHPAVDFGRIGVLLVNLGTPDGTDEASMRRYLKEFLSDRRVIETSRLIWWPVLNFIVLRSRPRKSGEAYALIWNRERDESPLRTITRSQTGKLKERLGTGDDRLIVDWAMRYGTPSIAAKLKEMQARGCERILFCPLYPQYAAATTATANDAAFAALSRMRWQPALRTLPPYFDSAVYIDALARSLKAGIAALPFEPQVVLASYHGLPQEYFDKGDPYHCHCQKTTRLLREKTGFDENFLRLSFQSRFGRAAWLQPYTDETIARMADDGIRRLAVITPGFSADCVETLEEIAMQNKEIFYEHGGEDFALVPCLNDSDDGMAVIEALVRNELRGWIADAGQ